ncbi:histidine kinase dimerization/phospho-acceptor domain-containing protein [Rufibacter sediminis]|uniref:histidine kinase dimerization/phospho-acceptor domain-containing protein n=1 Tax=Rufibacter sediminis TaxID=2762756 RepID=UPI001F50B763|nr:histidine kinase dimerization/phospho-acceptor domain-containing protein [Rufibacter sediminis]
MVTEAQGKETITGIVDHITAQKESVANMQKFAAKKDSVLEILSHDLAGPLNNIHALTEILSESTERYGDEEVNETIRIIRESCARNVRLIREFVQQEFLESSQTVMKKSRVDLGKMVWDIIEQ